MYAESCSSRALRTDSGIGILRLVEAAHLDDLGCACRRPEVMKANMSSILLGVRDIDRPKRFYPEGSGGRLSATTASGCSSSRTAPRPSASTAARTWPSSRPRARRAGSRRIVLTWPAGGEARAVRSPRTKGGATSSNRRHQAVGRVRRFVRGPGRYIGDIGHRAQGKNPPYEKVAALASIWRVQATRRLPG